MTILVKNCVVIIIAPLQKFYKCMCVYERVCMRVWIRVWMRVCMCVCIPNTNIPSNRSSYSRAILYRLPKAGFVVNCLLV